MTGNDKIQDGDLAIFAAAGGAAKRSVIVEAEVPGALAARRTPAKKLVRRGAMKSATDDRYATASAKSMARVEALLAELGLLADAVKLPAAVSFVVDAGPEQLRALSASPLVAAIRPNRMHRAVK
ncbi:MAG: hypothetical protein IT518_26825 [Burkholderiales bacterium]|nr:hypothetical protein [Burkholderiales bacterium]